MIKGELELHPIELLHYQAHQFRQRRLMQGQGIRRAAVEDDGQLLRPKALDLSQYNRQLLSGR